MAHSALIDAVHRRTADTAAQAWAAAREEADRRRNESHRALEEKRAQLALRLRTGAEHTLRSTLRAAERQARATRGAAHAALAGRLLSLARGYVSELRDAGYAGRFQALAGELPDRPWTSVTVNPADLPLARSLFANCDLRGDPAVVAGLIVESGGLRITNTFDQRLAAAWPDLQPAVMSDAIDHHARPRSAA